MVTAGACDTCHSPIVSGSGFDGVNDPNIGAAANWDSGVYESDGMTLQSGKEQWCAGCHDDESANSQADDTGVDAPNVIGNNTDYGFYVTGHNIACLSCHDVSRNHIDGEHRTYDSALDNYQAGYRLADSLQVPRPTGDPIANKRSRCYEHRSREYIWGVETFVVFLARLKARGVLG